ncbi:MAG: hypothetical protein R2939_07390 [Kofleriaceae bacterium]
MAQREFEGPTPAEAAIAACAALGVRRPELRYEVVADVGTGPSRQVRIRVLDVVVPPPPAPPVIGYAEAIAPFARWIRQDCVVTLDGVDVDGAFVDFAWLAAQDEATWASMEHTGDRADQLVGGVAPAVRRALEEERLGVVAAIGVRGTYWEEYGFDGSGLRALLLVDLTDLVEGAPRLRLLARGRAEVPTPLDVTTATLPVRPGRAPRR